MLLEACRQSADGDAPVGLEQLESDDEPALHELNPNLASPLLRLLPTSLTAQHVLETIAAAAALQPQALVKLAAEDATAAGPIFGASHLFSCLYLLPLCGLRPTAPLPAAKAAPAAAGKAAAKPAAAAGSAIELLDRLTEALGKAAHSARGESKQGAGSQSSLPPACTRLLFLRARCEMTRILISASEPAVLAKSKGDDFAIASPAFDSRMCVLM